MRTASGFCLAVVSAALVPALLAAPVTWNREELFAVPKSWPAERAATGVLPDGVRASFLEGVPFRGRATRVFAYWGVPAGATDAVPGMVLVHGGGGSAFANWVKFWNDRGYAAISMDLNGRVSGDLAGKPTKHERHEWAGPGAAGCGGFDLLKERPEDQWMYHAVAAVVKAHSFLRAQPGVDRDRIGMTGVSWGGVVNCVVASVDDRLKFAIPVYGCGFLYEPFSSWTHRYGGAEAQATRQRKEAWSPLWDPMNYLPEAKIPVHWLNGTNDGNFSLPSLQRSCDLVPTAKSLSLRVRMGHCHGKVSEQAVEVVSIADAAFRGAPALPKVGRASLGGGRLSVPFEQDDRLPVREASLAFTADDSFWWYSNRWESVSADVSGGRASADVPPKAKWAYLSVVTTNGAVVSSDVLDVSAARAAAAGDVYLGIMERAVTAYSDEHILQYVSDVERDGVQEHGFPRLTANLGVLVANGRLTEKKDVLKRMMTASCRDAAKGKMPPKSGGNEFSVKELAYALVALEKAGSFPKDVTDAWRADLTSVDAKRCYSQLPPADRPKAANWPIFGAASEQVRLSLGLGGDPAHVEYYVADQLKWFDELGMYKDPSQPAVYDMVTRLQFAHILSAGYGGPSRSRLEELMDKSAEPTLKMLSACGEIPYGGRSNQFLHNHTFYAALCEWYAARYAARGETARARAFKSAAKRATDALVPWLERKPVSHVKNGYPREVGKGVYSQQADMGCERYAYFDKYMITMGSWAMGALQFCAGSAEKPDLAPDASPSVFVTSPEFHWVFLSAGPYSAQFDWDANVQYDSSGLGRIHRRGAPPAICLSTPCARHPHYRREIEDGPDLAILPVAPEGTPLRLRKRFADGRAAHAEWAMGELAWTCTLAADGFVSTLTGPSDVALALPAFESDGATATSVACDGKTLSVTYGGWVCRSVAEDGAIVATDVRSANRNGVYRRYEARGKERLTVRITIERKAAEGAVSKVFDVRAFGAAGDGVTKDTAAIQRTIDAAAAAGGGEVLLSGGTFLSGSLYLRDNIDFHLAEGTVLKGSTDLEDYNSWDVCPQNTRSISENTTGGHLLLCIERRNVTIRGPGCIDGNAAHFAVDANGRPYARQADIPWRPGQMVYFVECAGIRLFDLELANAPYWSCFLHGCEDVEIFRLNVHTMREPYSHNGDGLDIDCCSRVAVRNCRIDTSDDSIAIRANRFRLKNPRACESVIVSDCDLSSDKCAIRVGVGDGLIHNVRVSDIRVRKSRTAVSFCPNWSPGGGSASMRDLRFTNFTVECKTFFRMLARWAKDASIEDVTLDGFRGTTSEPAYALTYPRCPFRGILFRNVDLPGGIIVYGTDGIRIEGGSLEKTPLTPEREAELRKITDDLLTRRRPAEYPHT